MKLIRIFMVNLQALSGPQRLLTGAMEVEHRLGKLVRLPASVAETFSGTCRTVLPATRSYGTV